MAYLYIKALHIVFVVAWFAGLFYMPRLLIYNVEAKDKAPEIRDAFHKQFGMMMKRLWYGITWPSAIITLIFGVTLLLKNNWLSIVFTKEGLWLLLKLVLVLLLYAYHYSMHIIFKQQLKGVFKYTSLQLRIFNEIAIVFLVAIVMLVVVKQGISLVWGLVFIVLLMMVLLLAIKIYKNIRKRN